MFPDSKESLIRSYGTSVHGFASDSQFSTQMDPDSLVQIKEQPSDEKKKKLQLVQPYPTNEFESLLMFREKNVDTQTDAMIQFSLQYDLTQSTLSVHLQYALNLLEKDSSEQCDPFVTLRLEPDREDTFQTKVIKNMKDPVFNQTFQFGGMLIQYMKRQMLVLRFYNHALNNKSIGKVCLQLRDVDLSGVIMQMRIAHTKEMEVSIYHLSPSDIIMYTLSAD